MSAIQIFPMSEVKERAAMAGRNVKSIDIYQGLITSPNQRGILALKITRDDGGDFPENQLSYTNNLRGDYTAVLRPGSETFYISSRPQIVRPMNGNQNPELYDFMAHQQAEQIPVNDLITRLIAAEKQVAELLAANAQLKEDLEIFETASGKFQHSLMGIWDTVIAPRIGAPSLNGPAPSKQTNTNIMSDLSQFPIQGNEEEKLEAAFQILYAAFGPDWLIKFATQLQSQPEKVQLIKSYFP